MIDRRVAWVAVTAALVYTLLSVRETAQRAASVLGLVEREIRPLATQLEALAEDLRGLSRQVTREVDRVSVVVRRIEEVSLAVVRLAGAVSGRYTRPNVMTGPAPRLRAARSTSGSICRMLA